MSLLNCVFIVAILVIKESANGAPLTELAAELKTATDALYAIKYLPFVDRNPKTTFLEEDLFKHRVKFDDFAKVLRKISESNATGICFEQLIDIKIFYEFLKSFGKYREESETLGHIIDSIKTYAEKVLLGLDKLFVEGEFEEHLTAARKSIAAADPNLEAIESFFHYYYYTEHKHIKVGVGFMFEAIEIFSYVGQKEVRRNFELPVIPLDPHVHRIYVILFSMGLNMRFTSEELHDHINLDVSSVESLTKDSDLYYLDNKARQIYVEILGGVMKYDKEDTDLLQDACLLAIGKISQIHGHKDSDKKIIVKHLVALAMVAIEYEHRKAELSDFGRKVAVSPEVALGLKLIKEVVYRDDFHLDSKIALKAVDLKVLVESKPSDHTQINADIKVLIKWLHSLPKDHKLGAITQISLHRLGQVSAEFVKQFSTVASYKKVAKLAENMGEHSFTESLTLAETLVRTVAPLEEPTKDVAAFNLQREDALLKFYIMLSSTEYKGIYLIGEEMVCADILEVHKFAADHISKWSPDIINLRDSLETQENIKIIERAAPGAPAAPAK